MGRLLKDKGFWEFVDAAKIIKVTRKNVRFCVLGFIDTNNPTAISSADLNAVIEVGLIEYLGFSDDVRSFINLSDCVVLPSYREGTPRALLEAAAMERPIIASDVAGCRDVVDDGVNGFLCNPYDAKDLAFKMKKLMELDPLERRQMGLMGRKKIESEFDELIIIKKYHKALKNIKFNL
jgi:glycosyltransferase involved in cell wall biosynthesis